MTTLSGSKITRSQKDYKYALIVKRVFDIIASLLGLLILSPLLIVISILIKLYSPGPVLFRRRLVGLRGRPFVAYKFRSMVANAHQVLQNDPKLKEEYQHNLKVTRDPRVTPLGRILRKTSLDELPQLFNILRGDMNLVGPRMLGDIELARYGDAKEKLLSVKPGLTGLWQVSGRHTVTFERRIELDLYYVNHWNLAMDLLILLKTIPAVLSFKGAE